MRFLSSFLPFTPSDPRPSLSLRLEGPRVLLRAGEPSDWQAWKTLREASRAFLAPWEPEWPANGLTRGFFEGMLRRQRRDWREGKAYAFFVFVKNNPSPLGGIEPAKGSIGGGLVQQERKSGLAERTPHPNPAFGIERLRVKSPQGGRGYTLAGGIGLNDIQRGIAQKATLGYWTGLPYARQGIMTEAAGLVCNFAFETLGLHRVEASCLPANEPSKKLLHRLGFVEEGYAKSYLRINGAWQDHILWGKIAP